MPTIDEKNFNDARWDLSGTASLAIADREELIHVAVSTQYQVCDRRMDKQFSTAYTALYIASHRPMERHVLPSGHRRSCKLVPF